VPLRRRMIAAAARSVHVGGAACVQWGPGRLSWGGPVHIGVNAHLLSYTAGYRRAGVSQYTEQLLRSFATILPDTGDRMTVYVGRTATETRAGHGPVTWNRSPLPTERAPFRIVWEQGIAPFSAARAHLDALFCPVNVVPLAGLVPSIVTVHDLAFLALPEAFIPAKRRYLSVMTRLSVHRARHTIAVSEQTKTDVVTHFGIAPERVTVIPNAVDDRFRPAVATDDLGEFRRTRQLPERYILFVGTLEPRKNLPRLIDAFARIAHEDREVGLVVVGASGWLNSDIAPLVKRLGLESRTTFAGYVGDEELARWYQAATVFCYPSLYEGFGLPVLEAMACGTPVVTSAIGSMAEIGRDAALLVDPTDVDAIANGLRSLLADHEKRTSIACAGLQRATAYSWERTAERTLAVLQRAAAR
jgi:glycosyltransferase involved in cell wall biosynthesis